MSPNYPEVQKRIWGGLALGQIGKLASATRQASVSLVPIPRIYSCIKPGLVGSKTASTSIYSVPTGAVTFTQDYESLRQTGTANEIPSGSQSWTGVSCCKRRMGAVEIKVRTDGDVTGVAGV